MIDELIYSYSRAEALDDGLLIDVSRLADEVGFRVPVAISSACWAKYVAVPPELNGIKDESGRVCSILWILHLAVKSPRHGRSEDVHASPDICWFELNFQNSPDVPAKLVTLKSVCHSGDAMEPVITIMLPREDWPCSVV